MTEAQLRVLVAGAHGGIGRRLVRLLVEQGHTVWGSIRNPDHAQELIELGAEPLLVDVEGDVAEQVGDVADRLDAIVYSIGAGPGSGAAKKDTVDRAGSDKLVELAEQHGISRYVIVSSVGAHDPSSRDRGDVFRAYLEAKKAADERVAASSLDWTIVRPGRLTDDPGTGRITASTEPGGTGAVTRDDVAATIAAALVRDDLNGVTFELFNGDTPIDEALDRLR